MFYEVTGVIHTAMNLVFSSNSKRDFVKSIVDFRFPT